MSKENDLILWFDQLSIDDVDLVGGKNASLGEMYRELTKEDVNIPNGFALTSEAYRYFLRENDLMKEIRSILSDLDTDNMDNLREKGHQVRDVIRGATFPDRLQEEVREAYRNLNMQYGDNTDVAVRSSATAEDLPDASFAGQQETYLNIKGNHALLDACKKCFASLFTNRAISYREDKGFSHFDVALSVGVQKMVRSDKASSGVMFSIDTESGFEDAVFITGAYGLGENIVQGAVNPDEFYVFKPTLKEGKEPIISRKVGNKKIKMIYDTDGNKTVKNVDVPKEEQDKVLKLAEWACTIEDHYSEKAGHFKPMDMEWAKDGETGELFIVQARPETVQSQKDKTKIEKYVLKGDGEPIVTGRSVGERIGSGKANVIKDVDDIDVFKEGQVLVTDMTDPDWEPIMKKAGAIVTNRGGRTCHAAIISRELGIPCLVGTDTATQDVTTGEAVTVDCSQGGEGYVYEGLVPYEVEKHDVGKIPETDTKIMMNLASPEKAFEMSNLPASGVGLAREEFIINNTIVAHPLALLNFDSLEDEELKDEIREVTAPYEDKTQFFVDKLAEGIGTIASAFYPEDVIVRLSDFKSNEYANLLGGELFEPEEDNPMIGWRGASRYYSDKYRPAFNLECKALKKVRDEFGLDNVKIMIPFCRTVNEGRKVLEVMEENGLKRGKNGLEVYVMCEIPSNILLAEDFLDIFDGFSIGSNDLTQLILGVDRDSELVSHIYNEKNHAVKDMIKRVIRVANEKGKYIGICGQAPSDFPDFARFLVEEGIQSISLNPDTVIKTKVNIAETEEELGR